MGYWLQSRHAKVAVEAMMSTPRPSKDKGLEDAIANTVEMMDDFREVGLHSDLNLYAHLLATISDVVFVVMLSSL